MYGYIIIIGFIVSAITLTAGIILLSTQQKELVELEIESEETQYETIYYKDFNYYLAISCIILGSLSILVQIYVSNRYFHDLREYDRIIGLYYPPEKLKQLQQI